MLVECLPSPSRESQWATSAMAAAGRIQAIIARMHEITRLKYMPDQAHNLPPTLDIRRSSQEGPEADPS